MGSLWGGRSMTCEILESDKELIEVVKGGAGGADVRSILK